MTEIPFLVWILIFCICGYFVVLNVTFSRPLFILLMTLPLFLSDSNEYNNYIRPELRPVKNIRVFSLILIVFVLMSSCSEPGVQEKAYPMVIKKPIREIPPYSQPDAFNKRSKEQEILAKMTLREKVAQVFIIKPQDLNFNPKNDGIRSINAQIENYLKDYPVSGFIMAGKNIESPEQVAKFIEDLQNLSEIPLFICVDEEGGRVARLANNPNFKLTRYKSAYDVGKNGKYQDGYQMGATIGEYLRKYGFNMNFAPVADVNTNPNNPVIGNRAFASDPVTSKLMAGALALGLRDQGIIPTYKHFPGHGDTNEDSHKELAISYKTEDELRRCEFIPFESASLLDLVMVGHIALPNITGDETPASLSKEIVTGILKEDLGFKGLVITDALEMGAITKLYPPESLGVKALQAGCDLLLMPKDFKRTFDGIISAVENDSFKEEELDKIVLKILNFKDKHRMLCK